MPFRIYTRTGDDGSTGLFGGKRVSKSDLRIEAVGSVDELNAQVGLAAAECGDPDMGRLLLRIQNHLFWVGADVATPLTDSGTHGGASIDRLSPEFTRKMEQEIDRLEAELEPLRVFILPGGTPLASRLHICRAVCRRAERVVIALSEADATNAEIIRYLNRLSDLLFVAARSANRRARVADVPWDQADRPGLQQEENA